METHQMQSLKRLKLFHPNNLCSQLQSSFFVHAMTSQYKHWYMVKIRLMPAQVKLTYAGFRANNQHKIYETPIYMKWGEKSKRIECIRMPVADDIIVIIRAFLVTRHIPLQMGCNVLHKLEMVLYHGDKSLSSNQKNYYAHLELKHEHLYV